MRHRRRTRRVGAVQSGSPETQNLVSVPVPVPMPEIGDRFIGPSGRIWTVQSIARRVGRIVLTRPADDGIAGAVVDLGALAVMAPLGRLYAERSASAPSRASLGPRLTAPALHHVTRDRQFHRGCHRRRVLIHLRFDETNHAHVDTYERLPV